jgi:hypothetical protein
MTLTQDDLRQFLGSEQWFRHWTGKMLYTDGIKHVAETAGAYWLLDIIATELMPLNTREHFLSIVLKVDGSKARLLVDDGNGHVLYEKAIEYTDFPQGEWKFYLIDGTLLLPSEY